MAKNLVSPVQPLCKGTRKCTNPANLWYHYGLASKTRVWGGSPRPLFWLKLFLVKRNLDSRKERWCQADKGKEKEETFPSADLAGVSSCQDSFCCQLPCSCSLQMSPAGPHFHHLSRAPSSGHGKAIASHLGAHDLEPGEILIHCSGWGMWFGFVS